MAKSFHVAVNPQVIVWARETRGITPERVAQKLRIDPEELSKIESGAKSPTIKHLKQFAKLYKRPLAAFFLPQPPSSPSLPPDFRSLRNARYTPELLLALRKARQIQEIIKELGEVEQSEIPQAALSDDPDTTAHKARQFLGISFQQQISAKNESASYQMWRDALESKAVFVVQVSGIPVDEMRGFSVNASVKLIGVNSRDPASARNFTLFHEFTHFMLNAAGICDFDADEQEASNRKQIEQFCNHVSGAFLLPTDDLMHHPRVKGRYQYSWEDTTLNSLARDFKVSPEAVLRRLTILRLAPPEFYRAKHSEWQEEYKKRPRPKVPVNVAEKSVKERGKRFVSLVLENYQNNNINASDVAEYLGVRLKHLTAIEKLVGT